MTLDLLTEEQFLNFFSNYKGLEGQRKGLLSLRRQMLAARPGLLGADNEWIKEYRNNPLPAKSENSMILSRPITYFRQTDSKLQGERDSSAADEMCFSSTMAMFANAFRPGLFRLPNGDDDYLKMLRSHGGKTGDASAHIAELSRLGIQARFTQKAGWEDLKKELQKGNPVAVGWYHNGPASRPRRDHGHWSLVTGVSDTQARHNDPNGEADLAKGGYLSNLNGEGLLYSRKNWGPRWMAEGPNTGWAIIYAGV